MIMLEKLLNFFSKPISILTMLVYLMPACASSRQPSSNFITPEGFSITNCKELVGYGQMIINKKIQYERFLEMEESIGEDINKFYNHGLISPKKFEDYIRLKKALKLRVAELDAKFNKAASYQDRFCRQTD